MNLNNQKIRYSEWTKVGLVTFERLLAYETAFDGAVKIYSLRTNNSNLNFHLKGKYFGKFIHYAENGVFLRMFKSKKSWPRTRLIYISFSDYKIKIIKKTRSSYDVWYGKDLGNGKHSIEIAPTKKLNIK